MFDGPFLKGIEGDRAGVGHKNLLVSDSDQLAQSSLPLPSKIEIL
jgi:hypothetical protein